MSHTTTTVLITGCSSGIGHALAREFKSRGFRVFATARSTSSISDLAAKGIETFSLQVQDASQITVLREQIASLTGGKLDILVNNAGRNYTMPATDLDFDEVRDVFETNVFSVMRMCKEFAPLLINARGTIAQIGSLAGVMPYVWSPVYNASKAALHQYSDTLRVELSPFGVDVVNIVTGGVKSDLARVERSLPGDSLYLPLAKEFADRQLLAQKVGMANEEYAKDVANKILGKSLIAWFLGLVGLGGRKRWIWAGSQVDKVWFATTFLPKAFLERTFFRLVNLQRLEVKEMGTKKLN